VPELDVAELTKIWGSVPRCRQPQATCGRSQMSAQVTGTLPLVVAWGGGSTKSCAIPLMPAGTRHGAVPAVSDSGSPCC
jgi:hypothetical protein